MSLVSEPSGGIKPNSNNYYDILIKNSKKNNKAIIPPRRINSQSNISDPSNTLTKRPSDYYIRKLSSSSINLARRPISGDSIISLNSTYSDEISLSSSNLDHHDSRLSSMTSKSIISPNDSPTLNSYTPKGESAMNQSLSTIEDDPITKEDVIAESSFADRSQTSMQSIESSINLSKSYSASALTLTRTKTKYLSQEEIKNRQKLRKKQYDDSYNEDIILPNDIDLVFNVPVIKNQGEVYFKKNIRNNLVDDNHYKPFPLPGKLRSNSTPNLKPLNTTVNEDSLPEKVVEEEDISNENSIDGESFDSFDVNDDSQIINNISNYYSQRSKSYSKLVQMSRQENVMYKLPNYIKSQSSMEDLNLFSPEKLSLVDQTRPINLPPKAQNDKMKHNKEMKRMLKDFERASFTDESSFGNDWSDLLNDKNFSKKIVNEKNLIRKLNWDSNCAEPTRYDYLVKLLTYNNVDAVAKIDQDFDKLYSVYVDLNESIKINRNLEFEKIISSVLNKPVFSSNLGLTSALTIPNVEPFKENFLTILFLKSIDNNLHKHDEFFLIPIIVLLFGDKSVKEQFRLVELFNDQIFTNDLRELIDKSFEGWSQRLPKKVNKFLQNFNLEEFANLDFNKFFEIMVQLNDKLPLSISASLPSTPISTTNLSTLNSCSSELIYKFLQLLAIYNVNYKTKVVNHNKIFQSFMTVIIKYYHINWNDFNDLIKLNKSIKLNFNMSNSINLNNFNEKWKLVFRNI